MTHKATLVPLLRDNDGRLASSVTDITNDADASEFEPCEHIRHDPVLVDWYRENPALTCARCFYDGKALATDRRDGRKPRYHG